MQGALAAAAHAHLTAVVTRLHILAKAPPPSTPPPAPPAALDAAATAEEAASALEAVIASLETATSHLQLNMLDELTRRLERQAGGGGGGGKGGAVAPIFAGSAAVGAFALDEAKAAQLEALLGRLEAKAA